MKILSSIIYEPDHPATQLTQRFQAELGLSESEANRIYIELATNPVTLNSVNQLLNQEWTLNAIYNFIYGWSTRHTLNDKDTKELFQLSQKFLTGELISEDSDEYVFKLRINKATDQLDLTSCIKLLLSNCLTMYGKCQAEHANNSIKQQRVTVQQALAEQEAGDNDTPSSNYDFAKMNFSQEQLATRRNGYNYRTIKTNYGPIPLEITHFRNNSVFKQPSFLEAYPYGDTVHLAAMNLMLRTRMGREPATEIVELFTGMQFCSGTIGLVANELRKKLPKDSVTYRKVKGAYAKDD